MLICEKCKKAFWITKSFFNHISKCEGNKDEVIGIIVENRRLIETKEGREKDNTYKHIQSDRPQTR